MIVRDLLNALQRFPGGASVTVQGRICVGKVCIAVGDACASARKGTKGAEGLELEAVDAELRREASARPAEGVTAEPETSPGGATAQL